MWCQGQAIHIVRSKGIERVAYPVTASVRLDLAESVAVGSGPEVTSEVRTAHNVGAKLFRGVLGVGVNGTAKNRVGSVIEVVVVNSVVAGRLKVDSTDGVARGGVAFQDVAAGRVKIDSIPVARDGVVCQGVVAGRAKADSIPVVRGAVLGALTPSLRLSLQLL